MPTIDFEAAFAKADHFRNNAATKQALALYDDIATLSLEEKNQKRAAQALHLAGVTLKSTIGQGQQSKFKAATSYLSRAYALFVAEKDTVSQGAVLRDIAVAADRVGKFTVALESFQRSIEILSTTEDISQLAITYDKLGLHFTRQGKPDQALPFIDKALDLLRQEPTSGYFWATTLLDRATTNLIAKKLDAALEDGLEALSWFEADHAGEKYGLRRAQCNAILGLIYQQRGDQKQAKPYAEQSNRLLKQLDSEVAAVLTADLRSIAELL
jgi:tetratricopeptide (TPR) repeat protein